MNAIIEETNTVIGRVLEILNEVRDGVMQVARQFVELVTNILFDLAEQLDTTPEGLITALAAVYGDQPSQSLGP